MDWDAYFMAIVKTVASKSKDRSTKVGCVIVGPDHEIRATGFNGFPRGINDDAPSLHERPEKYFWTEHAERNAIYAAARVGVPLDGCIVYLDWYPCMDCARALVQTGIREVVVPKGINLSDGRWAESFARTKMLFAIKSIQVRTA